MPPHRLERANGMFKSGMITNVRAMMMSGPPCLSSMFVTGG